MKKYIGALLVAATLASAGVAMAAVVGTNGSFETSGIGDPGTFTTVVAPNSTAIPGWTVATGSIDYIGSYWQASNGSRSIDLNGLQAGSLTQTFATVVGATYTVSFDMSGNPDSRSVGDPLYSPSLKVMTVSATGAAPASYTFNTASTSNSLTNMMWQGHTYTFTATATSTTLTFASAIPGAFGPALDNVVINETLPTPSANDCKNGGWKTMNDGSHMFKNQGDCVSFFSTGGKNTAAGSAL